MQATCSNCSTTLDPDAVFCPSCGAAAYSSADVTCPSCAKTVSRTAKFCKYCAFALAPSPQPATVAAWPAAAAVPRAIPATPYISTPPAEPAPPAVSAPPADVEAGGPSKAAGRFPRLGRESRPFIPILTWGAIGVVAGLVSYLTFILSGFGAECGPGIVLGVVLFLFGEFSGPRRFGRWRRLYTFPVIVGASVIGWHLALHIGGGGERTAFGIPVRSLPDVLQAPPFLIAGMVGGSCIVLSELLCWRFTQPRWLYAVCVIAVAGMAGMVGVGGIVGLFVIWQGCVLAAHAVAFGADRRRLITSTVLFVALATSVSVAQALQARAERERAAREAAQKEAAEAQAQREQAERAQAQAQRDKEEAEKKAQEEKTAREKVENETRAAAYLIQVGRQLDTISGFYAGRGFSKTRDYEVGSLRSGETSTFPVTLNSGIEYRLLSACDNDCSDIDIVVYDESGNQVASDTGRNDKPVVTVIPRWTGRFRIKVTMYKCSNSPCAYGIGVFGKG